MIYLDNNATTRPSPAVVTAMAGALAESWANPSSVHRAGQVARRAVELARESVAALIGGKPAEVTFTGSGTEAIDLAIRGALGAQRIAAGSARAPGDGPGGGERGAPVLITSEVEHAAVRDLATELARDGVEVRTLAVERGTGAVDLAALEGLLAATAGRARVVSVQWANNETGVVQPIAEVSAACARAGAVLHCDGTQWVGKEPVADRPCDLLTFSPHKFHGPKGVGVVWSRRGVRLRPVIAGTQELGRRGGTENVPGIVGAGVAAAEARAWLGDARWPDERARLAGLRDAFEREILQRCAAAGMRAGLSAAAVVNGLDPGGAAVARLWNTTNIGFRGLEAEALLLALSERGVCASAGAACSSGSLDPSPVLLAMGVEPAVAHGSLRFSLSRWTTAEELTEAAGIVAGCVARMSVGA